METRAIAYRASGRIAAAILMVISRGSLLVLVALLLFLDARLSTALRLSNPLGLLRAFSILCLAPGIAGWLLRSRNRTAPRWFVVFALVPTLPLFRLHQWIAYGGTFGEYYTYGLKPYLLGFAIYWATSSVHLVLYAAALRAVAEPIVLAAAYVAPPRTPRVRRAVETL